MPPPCSGFRTKPQIKRASRASGSHCMNVQQGHLRPERVRQRQISAPELRHQLNTIWASSWFFLSPVIRKNSNQSRFLRFPRVISLGITRPANGRKQTAASAGRPQQSEQCDVHETKYSNSRIAHIDNIVIRPMQRVSGIQSENRGSVRESPVCHRSGRLRAGCSGIERRHP
jgi:hypothetical protein